MSSKTCGSAQVKVTLLRNFGNVDALNQVGIRRFYVSQELLKYTNLLLGMYFDGKIQVSVSSTS